MDLSRLHYTEAQKITRALARASVILDAARSTFWFAAAAAVLVAAWRV